MTLINSPESSPRFYWDTPEAKAKLDLDRVQKEIDGLSDEDIARAVLAISKTSIISQERKQEKQKEQRAQAKEMRKLAREYAKLMEQGTQPSD